MTGARAACDYHAMIGNAPAAPDADVAALAVNTLSFADNPLTRFIDRARYWLFAIVALLFLLTFNGQWRIGLDSANYRGLADSLASGRGYVFGTWAPKAVYPGLPILLAALQKLCGASVVVPCIVMNLMAAGTLWLAYALIRLRHPRWIAAAVVFLVGTNSWFLQLANELLTDMPFLFGLMIALYGWERLSHPVPQKSQIGWIAMVTFGLALAGTMRPTFWIVLAAWGTVSLLGLLWGPRRLSAVSLAVLLGLFVLFVAFDPRSRGFNPFGGSPERQALNLLTEGPETVRVLNNSSDRLPPATTTMQILWQKTRYILHDQLPTAFYGQRCAPLSILASIVLITASLMLWRQPLWLMLVLLTLAVTIFLSAEPRYYIMVLPLLSLGWILMLNRLLQFAPGPWGKLLAVGLMMLVEGNNISRDVPIILEQRSTSFLQHYHKGEYVPLIALAEQIRATVPAGGDVLGPSGSVLSYFSGRHVWTMREVFSADAHLKEVNYPQHLAELNFAAAVFPARLYWDKEPTIYRMMERRIIVATRTLFANDRLSLATAEIRIPEGDWRKLPKALPKINRPPKRKHKKPKPVTTTAAEAKSTTTLATP